MNKFWVFYIGLLVGMIFVSSMYYIENNYIGYDNFISEPSSSQEIVERCINLTIEDGARCLVSNVRTFYNYTLGERDSKTISDFKQNGGNCVAYSNFYKDLALELGYNATILSHQGLLDVKYGHEKVIIWDNTTNCILDQNIYYCNENIR